MSISARLLRSLNRTAAIVHEDVVYASNEEALVASLKILETRESFHDPLFSNWRDRLEAQLAGLIDRLSLSRIAPDLFEAIEAIRTALAGAPDGKAEREAMQRATMRDWSLLVERLASDPRIDAAERPDHDAVVQLYPDADPPPEAHAFEFWRVPGRKQLIHDGKRLVLVSHWPGCCLRLALAGAPRCPRGRMQL